jgi:hypothetical protein
VLRRACLMLEKNSVLEITSMVLLLDTAVAGGLRSDCYQ